MIGISGSLIWSKTLMELIFNPCSPAVNFSDVWRDKLAKSTLLTSTLVPLGSFRSFKVSLDAKERVGAESNRKLPHLSFPNKIVAWVPEFAVEDLPLIRSAALISEFAVNDLSFGKILYDDDDLI